jgi:hypothetical protein
MCFCRCNNNDADRPRRGPGLFRMLFNLVLLYVLLVFGGGTLIQTGHPVAVEVGKIMHMVTFVEPTLQWADSEGHPIVAGGLRVLAHGVDVGRWL